MSSSLGNSILRWGYGRTEGLRRISTGLASNRTEIYQHGARHRFARCFANSTARETCEGNVGSFGVVNARTRSFGSAYSTLRSCRYTTRGWLRDSSFPQLDPLQSFDNLGVRTNGRPELAVLRGLCSRTFTAGQRSSHQEAAAPFRLLEVEAPGRSADLIAPRGAGKELGLQPQIYKRIFGADLKEFSRDQDHSLWRAITDTSRVIAGEAAPNTQSAGLQVLQIG